MSKKKSAKKRGSPGPKADTLKLEGNWRDATALKNMFAKNAPVTVVPGCYLYAYTYSDAAVGVLAEGRNALSSLVSVQTKQKFGIAENPAVNGILPASQETLTTAGSGRNAMIVVLEP